MSRSDAPEDRIPTWEEIARDHGRFLYTVAYRLTGNHDDAQDLVQDVLLRVNRGLATYKPGSLEGWLSRITTNAFLDRVRARKRRPLEALPDDIQAALIGLPEDYRAAVVLCDVVGFSYQEIADSLDLPVGTVRSRIHRGRSRLREVLVDA